MPLLSKTFKTFYLLFYINSNAFIDLKNLVRITRCWYETKFFLLKKKQKCSLPPALTEIGFPSVSNTTREHVASNPNPFTSLADISVNKCYKEYSILLIGRVGYSFIVIINSYNITLITVQQADQISLDDC